jgi:hypothetical protein
MSKPTHIPARTNRNPQHCITTSSSPSTATTKASKPHNTIAVLCSNIRCHNSVDVVPFGYQMGLMRINVRCGECQPQILVVKGLGEYDRKKMNEVGKEVEGWDWPGEERGGDTRRDSAVEGYKAAAMRLQEERIIL